MDTAFIIEPMEWFFGKEANVQRNQFSTANACDFSVNLFKFLV